MNIKSEEAAVLFKALGHPIRLTIVRGLSSRRCNVTSISEKLRLPQATVSQHLGVLRRAGVIGGTRKADGTCYRVVHPLAIAIARMLDGR